MLRISIFFTRQPTLLIIFICLLFLKGLTAQKLYLDGNFAILRSIGKDVVKTYNSRIQPLEVGYFSRKKFEQPYFNLLGNLAYAISPNILLGLQSGVYAHFSERYFGYTESLTISIPVMGTLSINIIKIKLKQLGLNVTGGKNFFDFKEETSELKNGSLFNESIFYLLNKKNILKIGIEEEVNNNEYVYFTARNPLSRNETFKFHLNRLSVVLSYGLILKTPYILKHKQ